MTENVFLFRGKKIVPRKGKNEIFFLLLLPLLLLRQEMLFTSLEFQAFLNETFHLNSLPRNYLRNKK